MTYVTSTTFATMPGGYTIGSNTTPNSTNFDTWAEAFSNLLNGLLGIETDVSGNPEEYMAKLWVTQAISIAASYSELKTDYVSPEEFLAASGGFIADIVEKLRPLMPAIRDTMEESEKDAAYIFEMNRNYGYGEEL